MTTSSTRKCIFVYDRVVLDTDLAGYPANKFAGYRIPIKTGYLAGPDIRYIPSLCMWVIPYQAKTPSAMKKIDFVQTFLD